MEYKLLSEAEIFNVGIVCGSQERRIRLLEFTLKMMIDEQMQKDPHSQFHFTKPNGNQFDPIGKDCFEEIATHLGFDPEF